MSENFKIIETQEQFDAAIADRLRRAEDKYKEKYSDYDVIKAQLDEIKTERDALTKQLEEANGKITGNNDVVSALKAQIAKHETDSVKTRIALEKGLPYEFASRLSGDDEEAIAKDAEKIAALIKSQQAPAPLRDPEPALPGNTKDAALRSMLQDLSK